MKKIVLVIVCLCVMSCNIKNSTSVYGKEFDKFWQNTLCVRDKIPELGELLTISKDFPFIGGETILSKNEFNKILSFIKPRLKELLIKSYNGIRLVNYKKFNALFYDLYDLISVNSIVFFDLDSCKYKSKFDGIIYGESEITASLADSFIYMLASDSENKPVYLDKWFKSLNPKGIEHKEDLFWVLVSMAAADKYQDMDKILELFSKTKFK